MCFSATASFTAAVGLSLLGIGTIKQTCSKRYLLLGSFPCLFALQQSLEGLVWTGIDNESLSQLTMVGTYGFLLFATFLWLILSPLSIYFLEQDQPKKRVLLALTVLGFLLGTYLLTWIIYNGIDPQVFSGNIFYDLKFIPFYEPNKYLYLSIIAIPFLITESTILKLFGSLIIISFIISQMLFEVTFVSVWCFFAAVLSGFLYLTIKQLSSTHENNEIPLIIEEK
ncbi:DUF6629 family protein [Crocosphaera sp.]|uniref:DUF6629 family protein n=1 Tax=Crocosphaera sp. TaxID=2729996 RepID=UPI0026389F24|nr:DUF6629 family protein [Crocosphaera sp.]MDJ0580305.1 hypothetical protein [Crocosphaera sp.]